MGILDICMEFLYLLEAIRCGVLDAVFSAITVLGEETAFMLVGMTVFWCIGKFEGYALLCTGFFGTLINQFLKIACRIPRPWVLDPEFTIVESAREAATGYSFPSGHTQNAVGTFGTLARWHKNRLVRGIMIALCVLVPFSRMYLGVHTPLDVGVSVVFAVILVLAAYPLFKKAEKSPAVMYAIIGTLVIMNIGYVLFVNLYPFPADIDPDNYASAIENGFTLLGCSAGLLVIYTLDHLWIKFETKAVWWAQILKVAGGMALILAAQTLLKTPLNALLGEHFGRTMRYFIMVLIGGALWPMTFKWFAKPGNKK